MPGDADSAPARGGGPSRSDGGGGAAKSGDVDGDRPSTTSCASGPPRRAGEDLILRDPVATEAVGAALAAVLRVGDVVALTGPLGAGKTSIARGLLAALGLTGEAPSPSYAIAQPYEPPEVRLPVLHVDLYRVDRSDDLEELGLGEARGDAALVIEWPERAGEGAWPDALRLALAHEPDSARRLTWHVPAAWKGRWPPSR